MPADDSMARGTKTQRRKARPVAGRLTCVLSGILLLGGVFAGGLCLAPPVALAADEMPGEIAPSQPGTPSAAAAVGEKARGAAATPGAPSASAQPEAPKKTRASARERVAPGQSVDFPVDI